MIVRPYLRVLGALSGLEWKRMPEGGISTYRGGRYCGPGWGFTREDVWRGRIKELPAALDAVDAACQRHDQCYQDHGYFTYDCNIALSRDLVAVLVARSSTPRQRLAAAIMAGIFQFEALTLDPFVGLYRDLKNSFETQFARYSMENVIQWHLEQQQMWGR